MTVIRCQPESQQIRTTNAKRDTPSRAPRRTQQDRREESDARIIAAAIELFAERGYQGTSLIQVGAAAGYTGALISSRFGSKQGLLQAVMAHVLDRFRLDEQTARMTPDGRPADALMREFIAAYMHDVAARQSRMRALHVIVGEALGGLTEIHAEVVNVNHVFRRRVAAYVAYGVETGAFRKDMDIDQAAILIVGLLRGVTSQFLAEPNDVDLDDIVPALQAAALAIVAP